MKKIFQPLSSATAINDNFQNISNIRNWERSSNEKAWKTDRSGFLHNILDLQNNKIPNLLKEKSINSLTKEKKSKKGTKKGVDGKKSKCCCQEMSSIQKKPKINIRKDIIKYPRKAVKDTAGSLPQTYPKMCFGSFNRNGKNFLQSFDPKMDIAFAMIAFSYSFIVPEKEWNCKTIDNILLHGHKLFSENVAQLSKVERDAEISQILEIDETKIKMGLSLPLAMGIMKAQNLIQMASEALEKCFSNYSAGIFNCGGNSIIAWQKKNFIYVFDSNGRLQDGQIDDILGLPVMATFKNLSDVFKFITNLIRKADENSIYTVHELQIIKLIKPGYTVPDDGTNFTPINSHLAIMNGSSRPITNLNEKIAASVVAIMFAKIDGPQCWSPDVIDKIIKFGKIFGMDWKIQNVFSIKTIPSQFNLGPWKIENRIILFRKSDVEMICEGIKDLFSGGIKSAILMVNKEICGVWEQNDKFYLFDPQNYFKSDDKHKSEKFYNLQRHDTLASIYDVIARCMNKKSPETFELYAVHVLRIEKMDLALRRESIFSVNPDSDDSQMKKMELKESDSFILATDDLSLLSLYDSQRKSRPRMKKQQDFRKLELLLEVAPDYNYESNCIANDIIDNFICAVVQKMCKTELEQKQQETELTENMEIAVDQLENIVSKQILLKSDLNYLEAMKKQLDYGFELGHLPGQPDAVISQDLTMHHFRELPDGSEILSGTENIFKIEPKSIDATSILVGVSAILVSHKYSLATWNSSIVDFVLSLAKVIENSANIRGNALFVTPNINFPTIKVGSHVLAASVHEMVNTSFVSLESKMEKCFLKEKQIIIISILYSCACFKRNNFYYFFEGLPTDILGFRTTEDNQDGTACLLRFRSLKDCVRRILFNLNFSNKDHCVRISSVTIKDVPERKKCSLMTEFQEQMVTNEINKKNENQIKFLRQEIESEKKRLQMFGKQDGSELSFATNPDLIENSKHPRGKIVNNVGPYFKELTPIKHLVGFQMRDQDYLYKIQGTLALPNRSDMNRKIFRECFCCGIYAIVMSALFPLSTWDSRQIDLTIENGSNMYEDLLQQLNYSTEKFRIDNVLVGPYYFNLLIMKPDKKVKSSVNKEVTAAGIISAAVKQERYLLIDFSSCCFAIIRGNDNCFYLFDSYASMELCKTLDNDNKDYPIGNLFIEHATANGVKLEDLKEKAIPDKNTASWIKFSEITLLTAYIDQRIVLGNYSLRIIKVISFKKAPKKSRMIDFMLRIPETKSKKKLKFDNEPMLSEEIKWLEEIDCIPWSRLQNKNLMKRCRYQCDSVWNEFDIEIDNDLYSLWGNIHPLADVFKENKGKNYFAISVMACIMANLMRLDEWNSQVLDSIVVNGDKYFTESIENIIVKNYQMALEDLNNNFKMDGVTFEIHLEAKIFGYLYSLHDKKVNLATALTCFFENNRYGILQCNQKVLAIGRGNDGFFMFDCQSYGQPLFAYKQGAAYILKCQCLPRLLHCIILTLNIRQYNSEFMLHSVEIGIFNGKKTDENSIKDTVKEQQQQSQPTFTFSAEEEPVKEVNTTTANVNSNDEIPL